jgi:phage tail-like protein
MPTVIRNSGDPYPGHNFHLIVNGVSDQGDAFSCAFTEITGLQTAVAEIPYRNGNEDITVRKLPGLKSYTNLVCKRGATGHTQFWDWIKKAMDGDIERQDGVVILRDENQEDVMRWNFSRAWPCKYNGPSFNATNNEIAMESVEICIEELKLDV